MSAVTTLERTTLDAYLTLDAEAAEAKYEFWTTAPDVGMVVALAGASFDHIQIVSNLTRALGNRIADRGCRALPADLRVRVPSGSYVYPDLVVLCGTPEFSDEQPDTLTNPDVLIEVISPSTAANDRGRKQRDYLQIPSLQEYWIVEQDEAVITQIVRVGDAWQIQYVRGLEAELTSAHLELALSLAEVYAQVELPDKDAA